MHYDAGWCRLEISPHRMDVPRGYVPDYKTFVRHVWSFEDENGSRAVERPPVMFEMRLQPHEAIVVRQSLDFLRAFIDKSRASLFVDGRTLLLQVYDLSALHDLTMALAARRLESSDHMAVAEAFVWALGFRWV